MQYLISVIDDGTVEDTADEAPAIEEFSTRVRVGGHWVFGGVLADPSTATVVDGRGERAPTYSDGPFLESKEHLGGFWIIDAADLDTALELAAHGSRATNRRIELRQLLTLDDVTEALR
jgi:hypothetical protein